MTKHMGKPSVGPDLLNNGRVLIPEPGSHNGGAGKFLILTGSRIQPGMIKIKMLSNSAGMEIPPPRLNSWLMNLVRFLALAGIWNTVLITTR